MFDYKPQLQTKVVKLLNDDMTFIKGHPHCVLNQVTNFYWEVFFLTRHLKSNLLKHFQRCPESHRIIMSYLEHYGNRPGDCNASNKWDYAFFHGLLISWISLCVFNV